MCIRDRSDACLFFLSLNPDRNFPGNQLFLMSVSIKPVSYTHLDVYKRQALNSWSFLMPPPMPKITSPSFVPIGTSMSPVFRIVPERENVLVPGLFSGPMLRYQ